MSAPARLGAALALVMGCGARSALDDPATQERSLVCGLSTVDARAGRAQTLLAAPPAGYRGQLQWTVRSGAPATVRATGPASASFFTEVPGDYQLLVHGEGGAGEIGACLQSVRVRGTAPGVRCAEAARAEASLPITLGAEVRSVAPIARTSWTLSAAPIASARPPPVGAVFTPDVVGDYALRFEAVDAQGERDLCELSLQAVPGPGLRVELSWDPPGRRCVAAEGAECDGADLDLHLLRLGGAGWGSDDDCHYANCNASAGGELTWGGPGPEDNPRLLRDDTAGHGPEVIALTAPAPGRYRVGVRYFTARRAGAQAASLAVYCNGGARVVGPATLPPDLPGEGAFWFGAEVWVRAESCEVRATTGAEAEVRGWIALRGRDGP